MLPFAQLAAEAESSSWRLLDLPPAWVVVMVVLPAAVGLATLAYWKEPVSPRMRALLITLRTLSFLTLLAVLFRPVRVESRENVEQPQVLFLVDDSASMVRKDAYASDPELRKRMAEFAGQDPSTRTRAELTQTLLATPLMTSIEERGYQTRLYRFSDALAPLGDPADLSARGTTTNLGGSLAAALASMRGKHLTDVVLVSDGRNTAGPDPIDAALAARAEGAVVHTLLVGDPHPEINLTVELVDAPTAVLQGDEVSLQLRVSAQGLSEGTSELTLVEVSPDGSGRESRAVDRADVKLEGDSARVVLVAPGSAIDPGEPLRRFRVDLAPLPKESLLDDNSIEVVVQVTTANLRVLYVEGFPRYEYRFLRELLRSGDERIQAQIFLMSATPDFPQDASPGMPSLEAIPTDRKTLLENYDVIILGDLDPYRISPDPARGEEFVASLTEFVEKGGGLCVIAGEYENPRAVADTDFARLLPVRLDTTGGLLLDQDTSRTHLAQLETPDAPHEIVRLHSDPDVNRALWETEEGLSGFLYFAPTLGAVPGSQVLLSNPNVQVGPNRENAPLIVAGYHPEGRTLFMAIDSTWRWRKKFKNRYHHRYWLGALRWLALGRLRSQDRRHQIESLEPSYSLDEPVVIEARVLDEDFAPSENPAIEVQWQAPGRPAEPLEMNAIEGYPGQYRLRRNVERVGSYQVWIEEGGNRVASAEFEVSMPSRETRDPNADRAGMEAIARMAQGKALTLAAWPDLLDEFPTGQERRLPVASELTDAWDRLGTLLAALALFSIEWILRKRHELI
ncbi:MAG: hypothetical protein R3F33_17275 [Planctomycetota bacterium]